MDRLPPTIIAGLYVVAGTLLVVAVLIGGDRVKLPGGFAVLWRREVRLLLGLLGVGLVVWGCVLWIGPLI
jgi:hypothetical protein